MNKCSEERLSLSDVTYREEEIPSGATAGIRTVILTIHSADDTASYFMYCDNLGSCFLYLVYIIVR